MKHAPHRHGLVAGLLSATLSGTAMADNPVVVLETSMGDLAVELFADKSPKTVENFLDLVDASFYDGLIFHRVIEGFVIQAGGHTADMTYKEAPRTVVNESNNRVANDRYTLSMARTSDPDSAGAQFYINMTDNDSLNYRPGRPGYTVFGRVIEGMEAAHEIERTKTGARMGMRDVPVEPVVITKAYRRP